VSERRIALVPPRYGPDVVGGAELVLREVAHGLAARGWEVEVLTTCALDHHTWANHYPAGTTTDGEVTVRRFPVVADTSGPPEPRSPNCSPEARRPPSPSRRRG
jgi:hypothetical protein